MPSEAAGEATGTRQDGRSGVRQENEAAIRRLRAEGQAVVVALTADDERPGRCTRILINQGGDRVADPAA